MEAYSNTQPSSASSRPGNGLQSSTLDRARHAQTVALEGRTARRIEELLETSPTKSRATPKAKPSSASSRRSLVDSPLLEHVRRTQIEAMRARTARRIEKVNSEFNQVTMDEEVLKSEFCEDDDDNLLQRESDQLRRSPPTYFEATSEIPEFSTEFSRVPESAMRRNITQRRSRGKAKDEDDRVLDASRVSRRPRSRSKDRRYSIESTGVLHHPELSFTDMQDVRSARAMVRPKAPASPARIHDLSHPASYHHPDDMRQSVEGHECLQRPEPHDLSHVAPVLHDPHDHGESEESVDGMNTVFMKHSIPEEDDHPQLRDHLLQLWEQRQSMAVAMNVALFEDDIEEFAFHQNTFTQINRAMHIALRDGLRVLGSPDLSTSKTQTSSSFSTPPSPSGDGSGPVRTNTGGNVTASRSPVGIGSVSFADPSSSQAKPSRWRSVDSLPLVEPIAKSGLKKSYKEDQHVFGIFLSFQGMTVSRIVNENLPLKVLYALAQSYLETDFHFRLGGDQDLDLTFDGRLLQRSGVISDIPLPPESVVVIWYPSTRVGGNPSVPIQSPYGERRPVPPVPIPSSSGEHRPVVRPPNLSPSGERLPSSRPHGNGRHHNGQSCVETRKEGLDLYDKSVATSLDSRSYDKIRQGFKCPKFSGQARDWKTWDKGFWRYLSIWELEYVLDPSFFDVLPLTDAQRRDNKLVYFVIEDAVQNASLGMSYVRQAALHNGFEAYYTLHDGYVFAGATTATLLLNELSNFRFLPDESPTALCLRLGELFQELRDLPGDAAVTFIDTQKVGYLVNALRHEKEWDYVCSAITSAQIKGGYSFHDACEELKIRCEASRVNDILDKPVKGKRVKGLVTKNTSVDSVDEVDSSLSAQVLSLISTYSKKHNSDKDKESKDSTSDKKNRRKRTTLPCLAKGCDEQTSFPLCPLHFHSLLSGKTESVELSHNYGHATYDSSSQFVVYPAKVPDTRLSSKQIAARNSSQKVVAKLATQPSSS